MGEPLYRVAFDAQALPREHPPMFRHPHKAALFELAGLDAQPSRGTIEVTRWAERRDDPIPLSRPLDVAVRADFYDYPPVANVANVVEWHVNFADPRLFVAYGSGLLAQDEMQIVEHPLLACVREALLAKGFAAKTSDETGATPILVRNVERRIALSTGPDAPAGRPKGLYGNRFAEASWDVVQRAARRIEPPTITNLIAIAAPAYGQGEYRAGTITSIFATAHTAFAAAREESVRVAGAGCQTIIRTGFWGCGAFGGNRKLMIALQALAARAAGVAMLILHAGDRAGAEDANAGLDVAAGVTLKCESPCALKQLIARCEAFGFRWGLSDGN